MKKRFVLLFFVASFYFAANANAETFKVAIMKTGNAGIYTNLFTALGEATNNIFEVEIVPPARATYMIENKLVDIQAPKMKGKNEAYNRSLKYDFATAYLGNTVAMVLYTNKDKPVTIDDLKNGNITHYKIETDGANVKQFGFTAIFSANVEQSLKKIASGRIDGYINTQGNGDKTLKSLKLKNIRRQLWDVFETSFTLQKGQAGGKLDKILADGLEKIKANGKYEQIMSESNRKSKYNDWQP